MSSEESGERLLPDNTPTSGKTWQAVRPKTIGGEARHQRTQIQISGNSKLVQLPHTINIGNITGNVSINVNNQVLLDQGSNQQAMSTTFIDGHKRRQRHGGAAKGARPSTQGYLNKGSLDAQSRGVPFPSFHASRAAQAGKSPLRQKSKLNDEQISRKRPSKPTNEFTDYSVTNLSIKHHFAEKQLLKAYGTKVFSTLHQQHSKSPKSRKSKHPLHSPGDDFDAMNLNMFSGTIDARPSVAGSQTEEEGNELIRSLMNTRPS